MDLERGDEGVALQVLPRAHFSRISLGLVSRRTEGVPMLIPIVVYPTYYLSESERGREEGKVAARKGEPWLFSAECSWR